MTSENPGFRESPRDWVRDQVRLYESSGGTQGTTLRDTEYPVVLITLRTRKTGDVMKVPVMRVVADGVYAAIASYGGNDKHPVWYYNLLANEEVTLRDRTEVMQVRPRLVTDPDEYARFWKAGNEAYPLYDEYQTKTTRKIPIIALDPVE